MVEVHQKQKPGVFARRVLFCRYTHTRMSAVLVQVNISNGGMPKLPVGQVHVSRDGVAGDWQKNRKYHGGPDRAICLFSQELYDWLRDEHGIDLKNGSVGENFTTRGIDMQSIGPGDRLHVGECLIEITMVRTPCRNLDTSKQGG
jgi:MOSC domain-containing protein YiiM